MNYSITIRGRGGHGSRPDRAHNPKHEPDEDALKIGVASTISYALSFLAYHNPIPFVPFQGTVDDFFHPV